MFGTSIFGAVEFAAPGFGARIRPRHGKASSLDQRELPDIAVVFVDAGATSLDVASPSKVAIAIQKTGMAVCSDLGNKTTSWDR